MRAWIDALRVRQWHKNLLVFVAIIFSQNLDHRDDLIRVMMLFVSFCFASSASYLLNDINDRPEDRIHPLKKNRAIARGAISPGAARAVAAILIFSSLMLSRGTVGFLLAYFGIQIFYNVFLRNVAAADVIAIAVGFIVRAVAGAVAIGVPFSEWLLICTFFGAVRLALGKRQAELHAGRTGLRRSWESVSDEQLRVIGAMTSAVLLVSYTLYSFISVTAGLVSHNVPMVSPLVISLPVVYFGIVRYELVAAAGGAGDPEVLPLSDKPLAIALLGWLAISFAALYLWRQPS